MDIIIIGVGYMLINSGSQRINISRWKEKKRVQCPVEEHNYLLSKNIYHCIFHTWYTVHQHADCLDNFDIESIALQTFLPMHSGGKSPFGRDQTLQAYSVYRQQNLVSKGKDVIRSCDNTSQNSNGKTDSYQISNFFFFFNLN